MRQERLGHYEILERLGQGAMGEVYRARDEKLGREVALKVLPAHVSHDADRRMRLEREARAVATLKHPNIVTLHSIEEVEGTHFLTMEFVEGDTVAAEMTSEGMSLEQFFDLAIPLADALASAHAKGIAHRDIKPTNLMRDSDGRVKILDFGLAKVLPTDPEAADTVLAGSSEATREGTVLGTVAYMSPEQAEGRPSDARSDVFSLGVVFYELLTGARPFQGQSNISTLSAILKDDPPSVSEVRPVLPAQLGDIVALCLEKDPDRRYPSASEVLEDLKAVRGTTEGGRDVAPPTPVEEPRSSRRGLFGFLAVGVIVAGLLFALSQRDATPPPVAADSIRSLAVLPFSNLSAGGGDDYFSAGMTDILTTELAGLSQLKVIARNAAARFADSSRAPAEIARELGVEALVSGTVTRDGDQVRISAQLAEAGTDRVVWAQSYERELRNALALQADVARAIVGAIALELTPAEESRLARDRAVDPRALEEYLKGRFHWAQRTELAVRQALTHFQVAVDIEQNFALGHAGIADAYLILGGYNWMEPREALGPAFAAVERSLTLDPLLGEAHATRGDLAFHVEHDFVRAAADLDRAIQLSPSHAAAYYWRAEVAFAQREFDTALRLVEQAVALDPLNPFPHYLRAFVHEDRGELDRAEQGYRHVLEFAPSYEAALTGLVRLDLRRGDPAGALAKATQNAAVQPTPWNLSTLGVAQAIAGRPDEARATMARLSALSATQWVSPYNFARIHAGLGEREAALARLRDAIASRHFTLPYAAVSIDIAFRGLEGDPEFQRLIGGIGQRASGRPGNGP